MNEFRQIVRLGRKQKGSSSSSSSQRGCLIQLEEDKVFLVNAKRSMLYELRYPKKIGSGVFFAGEAPIQAEKIQLRDDRVLFEWEEKRSTRRIFVPTRRAIDDDAMETITTMWKEPTISLPDDFLSFLNPDILITTLSVEGNIARIRQARSDGTVEFESDVSLGRGFMEREYEKTGKVNFFTADLYFLIDETENLSVDITPDAPLSLKGELCDNEGRFIGLVSNLKYGGE